MIEELNGHNGNIVGFKVTGRFTGGQMKALADRVDAVIAEAGPVRLLVELEDFRGIEVDVLWEKAKFAFAHLRDIERMAVVGDRLWEEWWVKVAGALLHAETRYFDEDDINAAWAWLKN
jgi:hypothetical protein